MKTLTTTIGTEYEAPTIDKLGSVEELTAGTKNGSADAPDDGGNIS